MDLLLSIRAKPIHVGGEKPTAHFESPFEEPFTLSITKEDARRLGALLYQDVDIEAEVVRDVEGKIESGKLLTFEVVEDVDPRPAWREWHQTNVEESLHIEILRKDAQKPTYWTANSAGMDLHACPENGSPVVINPFDRVLIGTGISIRIPQGYEGQIRPRSGLAWHNGITVLNSPGTIDADYRGEIKVLLINLGKEIVTIMPGDRIAQLVISSYASFDTDCTEVRGEGGWGSTGK